MENLTISDAPPQGAQPVLGGRAPPPQQTPQLPPQMFTTAAQLLDMTDKKLMVALRDGRKLIGVLRSWDQFGMYTMHARYRHPVMARGNLLSVRVSGRLTRRSPANLVLQDTVERVYAYPDLEANPPREGGMFADIKRGIFLVRGENVLLLGEIDLDKDDDPPPGYEPADLKLVQGLAAERKDKDKARDKGRIKKLSTLGFEGENMGEILL
ncbi:LSM domain-containing protein [Colletotrichum higginsianum IMI 349063]|uniref:U6 snRNA-associated Sm-like protein LSm1 n=1 Tax=Colletotrichum higginsianum (strain IMI 349063) TaxID=759273 RepID=A0A1B7XV73_COLHI|nr:LSM domain-containing protein [Colletotrichum higginsianum IMI 349063]OBR03638.1 LSM domain-containing protein [Colletotrichum higginsianum IMI 349063]